MARRNDTVDLDIMDNRILLVSAFLYAGGLVIAACVPRWAEANERRRTRYAEAIEALVAWAEYPYRVARRTDNKPETLSELAKHGHSIQEQLGFHKAWISSENRRMGSLYQNVLKCVKDEVGSAVMTAWQRPPATLPSDMNIGNLNINQSQITALTNFLASVSLNRFGWRRIFGSLKRRIKKEAALVPGLTAALGLQQKA